MSLENRLVVVHVQFNKHLSLNDTHLQKKVSQDWSFLRYRPIMLMTNNWIKTVKTVPTDQQGDFGWTTID